MEDVAPEKVFCSNLSLQADEPLIASATLTTQFLLLEYNGPWGEKAFEESDLPEAVKDHLDAYARARKECKILMLRSPRSLAEPGVRFFAAQVSEASSQVYEFHIERYEELLSIDLAAVFAGDVAYATHRRLAPVYLVCTHGRRDRCCARVGIPVYTGLLEAARSAEREMGVWQCSHVGGHRFAANLISLSSGLLYGRVGTEDVEPILSAERRGEMRLEHLRGRLCYPAPAQAAEAALRRASGEMRLWAFRLDEFVETGPSTWAAVFAASGGERYRAQIRARKTGVQVYESCTLDKTTPVVEYSTEIEAIA